MAEAVGLVLGVPALFTSCVEFLDYITLERNYGKDFEVSLAKVSILKGRLYGCGKSLSVITPANHTPNDSPTRWKPTQTEAIRKSLVGLQSCFKDQHKLEKTYGLKPATAGNLSMIPTTHSSSNTTTVSPSLAEVTSSFNLASIHRQNETPFNKKVWWAIHDKKKFDALVFDALFYIESLEALCSELSVLPKVSEDEIVRAAVERVHTREGIRLLQEAVDEMPSRLAAESARHGGGGDEGLAESTGHIHIRTVVSAQARVVMGDAGLTSDKRHYFRDAKFDGRILAGDASVDAVKALFA